jgi:hypothetical protein
MGRGAAPLHTGTIRRQISGPIWSASCPYAPRRTRRIDARRLTGESGACFPSGQSCHAVVPDKGARDSASGRPVSCRPVCGRCLVAAGTSLFGCRDRRCAHWSPPCRRPSCCPPSPRRVRASGLRRVRGPCRLLLRTACVFCRHSSAQCGDRRCRRRRRDAASGCDGRRARPSPRSSRSSSKISFVIPLEVRPLTRRASAIMFEVGVHVRAFPVCAYPS